MEQKRGEWKQRFLKGGRQAELRGGCLKKRGLEPPYELWIFVKLQKQSFSEHIHFAAASLSLNIIPLYGRDVFITILLHTDRFILYFCNLFEMKQENAMRYNNRNDLLQLSFTLKISIFLEVYI